MYSLETIKSINNRPRIIRDNFNRDSSFVQSSKGFVIHSGIHRSTAFISKEEHADSWHAFGYWSRQGQKAVNAFVESIIDGATLDHAEAEAFKRCHPQWEAVRVQGTGKNKGAGEIIARRKSGRLVESVGAFTWRHLHARARTK